jgi:hypothetical protein
MRSFLAINKRNLGLYFRDYSAVFFSLLSMLIIIMLMVFFLGDINNSSILDALKMVPGRGGDSDAVLIDQMSFLWVCAGIFGGIYFPMGSMSSTMQIVVKCFPFIYGTSLFRKIMLAPLENTLFSGTPEIIRQDVDKAMGVLFNWFGLSAKGVRGVALSVAGVYFITALISYALSKGEANEMTNALKNYSDD